MDSELEDYLNTKSCGEQIKQMLNNKSSGVISFHEMNTKKQDWFYDKIKSYNIKFFRTYNKELPSENKIVYFCKVCETHCMASIFENDDVVNCGECNYKIYKNKEYIFTVLGEKNIINITFDDISIPK